MTTLTTIDRASSAPTGALGRVGGTPLIRLQRLTAGLPPAVEVFAKAEWMNPSGSVKDRPAAWILHRAIEDGRLSDGRILLALGADLTLTDPTEGSDGARTVAAKMASEDPARFFYADQYGHPANWQAHFHTTGPEIADQTERRITHFVAGLGTTGTITGAGRYLRQTVPGVRIVGVQPATPLHGLEGLKHLATSTVPPIFDPAVVDEMIEVETEQAYDMARRIAREEGLLVGVSAAAAAVASLELAGRLERAVVVAVF